MAVKNWSDGDYVYGTDLDDLVTSTVMHFADTATRSATLIGDIAPKPGMLSYLDSTRRVEQYITVSSVGYWAPLPGTLVAVLRQLTTQSMAPNTDYVMALDIEDYDVLNGHATGASRYVCQVPGWYEFTGGTAFSGNGTGTRISKWSKNGAVVPGTLAKVGVSDTTPFGMAARPLSINLLVNDYVEIVASHTADTTLTSQAGSSTTVYCAAMSVKYVGAP